MGRQTRRLQDILSMFTEPELKALARVVGIWKENKSEFFHVHQAKKPREILLAINDLDLDGQAAVKDSATSKIEGLLHTENGLLFMELQVKGGKYLDG